MGPDRGGRTGGGFEDLTGGGLDMEIGGGGRWGA
jgi:hypothetical protein